MPKMKIEDIDPNFASDKLGDIEFDFYDVTEKPFTVYGLLEPSQRDFKRMPYAVAESLNPRIEALNKQTSGGRIKFKSDSSKIAIKFILPELHLMKHMPLNGSSFFDLYVDGEYCKNFTPDSDIAKALIGSDIDFVALIDLETTKMRELEINFPIYNAVSEVYIGVLKDSAVEKTDGYRDILPVVYYGSSITQGGCASHPGNAYPNILSRRFNCDFINLGFSGNCKGELKMAEYISSLDMSVFVFDYDHNAKDDVFLQNTHEAFFKLFRSKKPGVPVVFITTADEVSFHEERRKIIYSTYKNAVDSGDKNVYFIDGFEMYKDVGPDLCTTDSCHPSDLGFWCMATTVEKTLKKII